MGLRSQDWSALPMELLCLVMDFLPAVDRIRCGCVCTSWHLASKERPYHTPSPSQSPWLMFAGEKEGCNFYSPSEKRVYQMDLPELCNGTWMGSCDGWLINADDRAELQLLNPFSRVQIPLPSITSLPTVEAVRNSEGCIISYMCICEDPLQHPEEPPIPLSMEETREYVYRKAVVSWSSPPSNSNSKWTVMVVVYPGPHLVFARTGDCVWTPLSTRPVQDVVLHKGQFYSLTWDEKIHVWDLSGPSPSSKVIVNSPPLQHSTDNLLRTLYAYVAKYALSSTDRELVLVLRERDIVGEVDRVEDVKTVAIEVYKLDHENGQQKWVRMRTLGDQALFIGGNSSFTLSCKEFPELKGNCVYFTDDNWEISTGCREAARDMGLFSLEDEKFVALVDPDHIPISNWPPPVWITPSLL